MINPLDIIYGIKGIRISANSTALKLFNSSFEYDYSQQQRFILIEEGAAEYSHLTPPGRYFLLKPLDVDDNKFNTNKDLVYVFYNDLEEFCKGNNRNYGYSD